MRHLVHVGPDVGRDRLAGQRGPGRLADEAQRRRGRHHPDPWPDSVKQPQQLARLVGGDAAADAEHDPADIGHRGLTALGRLGGQQAAVDLAQGDRQRLLLRGGLHQRADVLQQALAELAVVGVDLAGALGREDHQRVLRLVFSSSSSIGGLVMPSGLATVADHGIDLDSRLCEVGLVA